MTVRVYRSTDVSAPTLSAAAGSLIAILDACLVNGYGSHSSSGWTKPFSGTNTAAYLQPSGNTRYLRIDDTGGAVARCVGYEAMTTVDIGTGSFPTDNQQTGGAYIFKSQLGGTISVPWVIIATQKMAYIWINPNNEAPLSVTYPQMYCFGDITSYAHGDIYNTHLVAQTQTVPMWATSVFTALTSTLTTASIGNWVARSYTGIPGSITCMKFTDYAKTNGASYLGARNSTTTSFPDPVAQNLLIAPVWVGENISAGAIRGVMPGVWTILNNDVLNMISSTQGPTINLTTGSLNGKTIELFACGNNSHVWIETSNTW